MGQLSMQPYASRTTSSLLPNEVILKLDLCTQHIVRYHIFGGGWGANNSVKGGGKQKDPLEPLLFCVTIHEFISLLES